MLLAGGAVAVMGCSTNTANDNPPNVPCGNANPDPCICGRQNASQRAADLCDQQKACAAAGGSFDGTTFQDEDGSVTGPHCVLADGGSLRDAASPSHTPVDGAAHD